VLTPIKSSAQRLVLTAQMASDIWPKGAGWFRSPGETPTQVVSLVLSLAMICIVQLTATPYSWISWRSPDMSGPPTTEQCEKSWHFPIPTLEGALEMPCSHRGYSSLNAIYLHWYVTRHSTGTIGRFARLALFPPTSFFPRLLVLSSAALPSKWSYQTCFLLWNHRHQATRKRLPHQQRSVAFVSFPFDVGHPVITGKSLFEKVFMGDFEIRHAYW